MKPDRRPATQNAKRKQAPAAAAILLLATFLAAFAGSCAAREDIALDAAAENTATYVASLGNLRTSPPPGAAEVELSKFLFGVEPEPPIALIKPMAIAPAADAVLVCDAGHSGVLRCDIGSAALAGVALSEPTRLPSAICVARDGDWLVADAQLGAVLRFATDGRLRGQLGKLSDGLPFRPAGIAAVGEEIWVTNPAAHRIEVFDAQQHTRSIGRRGRGRGEFGAPLGITVGGDGNVYVVDMLGCRVQVFSPDGAWIRDIGAPGDRSGYFGRPRDVAVGPDGVIFVTDAASQRVHAFDARGRALLSFGGPGQGNDSLVLPAGIAICMRPLLTERTLPAGFSPAYYVLVAEQMVRPGVRVFAWRGGQPAPAVSASPAPLRRGPEPTVSNPHWRADSCTTCHTAGVDRDPRLDLAEVDTLCISCHDGMKARAESHPIGWPAAGSRTAAPEGWPLSGGRIGCVTCHSFEAHCRPSPQRPTENVAFVRGFDVDQPLAMCRACHTSESWRLNPHLPEGESNHPGLDMCTLCHAPTPPTPAGGRRSGVANLRGEGSRVCLGCHTMHVDPAPNGHLNQPLSGAMMTHMHARRAAQTGAAAELPLADGRVACYSCHNPHARDTFVPTSALGAAAAPPPGQRDFRLRLKQVDLCLTCHDK
ncbi:Virginiamycin B lyase [Phycisphaerae bacterium RAS1]|nr:Virginiamycin B lyase [Phycisphaerae bacterium RAS1]